MSTALIRLASSVVVRRLRDGRPKLIQTRGGHAYTLAKGAWPLVERVWCGLSKSVIDAELDPRDKGLLLTFSELGLLEEWVCARSGQIPVEGEIGRQEDADVFPCAHLLITAWALGMTTAMAEICNSPSMIKSAPWSWLALAAVPLLWVVLHEYAHLLTARLQGIKVGSVRFERDGRFAPHFYIGSLEGQLSDGQRYLIYMAGPVANCVLSTMIFSTYWMTGSAVWLLMTMLSLGFTCFCLFAIPGMDVARARACIESAWKWRITYWQFLNTTYLLATASLAVALVITGVHTLRAIALP